MIILVVITIFLLLWFLWSRRHLYALSWRLPGPPAWPIVGNVLPLWNENENMAYIDKVAETYPSPMRVWMGPNLYIFVHDADSVNKLLHSRTSLDKPDVYAAVRDALGSDGLFSSKGDEWKLHRRLMSPALKESTIVSHLVIFNHHIREFVKGELVKKANEAKPFDVITPLNVALMSMFLDATMGIEWTYKSEYSNRFAVALAEVAKRLFRPWLQIDWIRKFTTYEKRMRSFRKFSDGILSGIIQRSLDAGLSGDTFIDKLIEVSRNNEKFTIDDIKVESHTLLLGASDTTAVTLATVMLMLAIHQDEQQKVFEELVSLMPSRDCELTSADLSKLPNLEFCIRESLRLFPTVPLIGRKPHAPIVLNNVEIPAELPIFIGLRQLHRRKDYWGEDAFKFKPSRFHSKNMEAMVPGSYIPFSLGPRSCVGYGYAMYTVKLVLAHVLRNYHLTSPHQLSELKIKMSISYRFINKHLIQLHRRAE